MYFCLNQYESMINVTYILVIHCMYKGKYENFVRQN